MSQLGPDTLLVSFEEYRPRLLGLAYRMHGTAAVAEDVVQEAFLRWHGADRESIEVPPPGSPRSSRTSASIG